MIKFEKVRFKNFGSFGNTFTEIQLNGSNTTLICGNNGSGKSFAFLDSITFALFGKPFRKINIPQMANSINQKNCIVEVEFTKGSDKFLIKRGINPRLFEIYKNDDLINQDAKSLDYQELLETQILKMNYKTFTQVVILGSSSFVPFMQLSASDRRNVIENILDINIFSTMNVVLKGKLLILKESIRELNTKIEIHKNKISVQENYVTTLEKKNNEDDDEKNKRIDELNQKIIKCTHEMHSKRIIVDDLISDISNIKNYIKEYQLKNKDANSLLISCGEKIKQKQEEINFFKQNSKCPTCSQSIEESIKKQKILTNNFDISNLNDNLKEIDNLVSQNNKSIELFEKNLDVLTNNLSYARTLESQINSLKNEIERINKTKTNSIIKNDLSEEKKKLIILNSEMNVLVEEKQSQSEDLMYYELASELLKDSGVKTKIIKHYLPYMNKFINKFLSSMDFFVQFELDEEFNEKIKSRHRDDFSYMNFSEGEKMRIDLALLLAWREIARMKNSISCNLLILDEVFDSSLDTVGMDELMKLIKLVSDKTNVYVISHKSDQLVDKFSNIVSFEKKNNFSKMINN